MLGRLTICWILLAMAATTPVAAAARPRAQTGLASAVTQTSATLMGTVDPRGEPTQYYFQFARTRSDLRQSTPHADAGSKSGEVKVSAAIQGLTAGTQIYYRVVAENATGRTLGSIRSFTTLRLGTSATLSSPGSVTYGHGVTFTGAAAGPGMAGARAALQGSPFPFSAAFAGVGNPVVTNAAGAYAFTVPALLSTTRFRVVVATQPQAVSPIVEVGVRVAVSMHLSDATPRRSSRVRFSGSVRPGHPGAKVSIQKKASSGRYVTLQSTVLRGAGERSTYATRRRVAKTARYRVRVTIKDGDHVSGTAPSRLIRPH